MGLPEESELAGALSRLLTTQTFTTDTLLPQTPIMGSPHPKDSASLDEKTKCPGTMVLPGPFLQVTAGSPLPTLQRQWLLPFPVNLSGLAVAPTPCASGSAPSQVPKEVIRHGQQSPHGHRDPGPGETEPELWPQCGVARPPGEQAG